MSTARRTRKKQRGGQQAPRPSRPARSGSVGLGLQAEHAQAEQIRDAQNTQAQAQADAQAPMNSTQQPGKGVLIDPKMVISKDNNPYYIVVDGKRVYGSSPEDVVGKLGPELNVTGAPLNTGNSGVGTLVNVVRARKGSPNKYYIVIKGKRYYGEFPADAIQRAKGATHSTDRSWGKFGKNVGHSVKKHGSRAVTGIGKGVVTGAKVVGKGAVTGARATGKGVVTGARAIGKGAVSLRNKGASYFKGKPRSIVAPLPSNSNSEVNPFL